MSGALEYAATALRAIAELGRTPIEDQLDVVQEGPVRSWRGIVRAPWARPLLEVPGEFQAAVLLDDRPVGGLDGFHRYVALDLDEGRRAHLELVIVPFGLMGVPVEVGAPAAWLTKRDALADRCANDLEALLEWRDHAAPSPAWRGALTERLHQALAPLLRHPVLEQAIRRLAGREGAPAEEAGLRRHLAGGDDLGLAALAEGTRARMLPELAAALEATYEWLSASLPPSPGRMLLLGHAHLDLAWLWPLAETRRKLVRTLANQITLLERHDDWRFVLSSGQYLAWASEVPNLGMRICNAIATQRVEPAGALWVESDAELTGPETLLASASLGIRTTTRLGGARPRVAFLPDTFGFAAGFPSILAHAGIELLVTTKLLWNDRNPFPYAEARWVGPDGHGVGLIVTGRNQDGYNAPLTIADLARAHDGHAQAGGRGPTLYLFGHGDGGGGPDEAMLERLARYRRLPCLPELASQPLDALLPLPADAPEVAGELYLERHRATPTQRSATKAAFVETEALALAAAAWSLVADAPPPPVWETIARASFHDILPGSGIAEVEHDALQELEVAADTARARLVELAMATLPRGEEALIVLNPSSRALPASVVRVESPSGEEVCEIPALAPFELVSLRTRPSRARATRLDLPIEVDAGQLAVRIEETGISHLRWRGRELLAAPAGIVAYRQHPHDFDAWELVNPKERTPIEVTPLGGWAERDGRLVVAHLTQRAGATRIELSITVDEEGALVLVEGSAEGLERRQALAFDVPTRLVAPVLWRQGLWGVDTVPTRPHGPLDEARFEWVAHGMVDLSEAEMGLALCGGHRFGHHAHGSLLGVTLATAPLFPDPTAERNPSWRLGLVAHDGDWRAGRVLEWAALVRTPPVVLGAHPLGPGSARPLELAPGVRLLALEPLDDGKGDWLLVVGEELGAARPVHVRPRRAVQTAWRASFPEGLVSDALEVDRHGAVHLWLEAFEVATLRLAWAP